MWNVTLFEKHVTEPLRMHTTIKLSMRSTIHGGRTDFYNNKSTEPAKKIYLKEKKEKIKQKKSKSSVIHDSLPQRRIKSKI